MVAKSTVSGVVDTLGKGTLGKGLGRIGGLHPGGKGVLGLTPGLGSGILGNLPGRVPGSAGTVPGIGVPGLVSVGCGTPGGVGVYGTLGATDAAGLAAAANLKTIGDIVEAAIGTVVGAGMGAVAGDMYLIVRSGGSGN